MSFLSLTEHTSHYLEHGQLSYETGEFLLRRYATEVDVEFPSPKTGGKWKLTPRGWVGYIPLPDGSGLSFQPKVPLGNLFRMLEHAYGLGSIRFPEGLANVESIEEIFDRLARVLSDRVAARARRGLYRTYLQRQESLPYIRGRVSTAQLVQSPWKTGLPCRYRKQTTDVSDNQILAWTLDRLRRGPIQNADAKRAVARGHRSLLGGVTLVPREARDCVGRDYNRLNDDYKPLHALCRFFLENTGPTHVSGNRVTVPFLVNMDRLFELFVAQWLDTHVSHEFLDIRAQDAIRVPEAAWLEFRVDLTIRNQYTGKVLCVLDTKYKRNSASGTGDVSHDDINQVVTYAKLKGASLAYLVYPSPRHQALDALFGDVRVRTCTFDLGSDIEAAGQVFLGTVLGEWRPGTEGAGPNSTRHKEAL